MDRRRAAGALLALAACFACSAAAPTASNQTALDLYEGAPEGCYYNFQHYGEGDRIMTNEPCLNCTCHNRMLMCYLRVCPFTKPIGQDCTVEKRADQCCPIVTCPDVPVDLLTSTSTTSPAEYGATGLGKLDKYGCSLNGKYFPEGSKVPPTPNKPCEHCYCIRNMTTCVMQECTLHVDGCTPIYHKDVCCPVRYSCDHPEDEIPLLDDMSTTVRPTPGFLLTTTTMSPVTQMTQDCVHNDQIIADGASITTEKACEHCYCMKGDIVCVVQECGAPMENEGKNCTSLPPRVGQCCPDTYICEGDELSTEIPTEITTGSILETYTTLLPPRRGGVEGSGYRHEPDEASYTEMPLVESELEGSGEEQESSKPTDANEPLITGKPGDINPALDEGEQYIPVTSKAPTFKEPEMVTQEVDRNALPEDNLEKDTVEPTVYLSTTPTPVEGESVAGVTEEITRGTLQPHERVTLASPSVSSEKDTTESGDSLNTVPGIIPEQELGKPHEYTSDVTEIPSIGESSTIASQKAEETKDTPENEREATLSPMMGLTSESDNLTPSTSDDYHRTTEKSNIVPELITEKDSSVPESAIDTTAGGTTPDEKETAVTEEPENVTDKTVQLVSSTTNIQDETKFTTEPDHALNTVAVAEEENVHPHVPNLEESEKTTMSDLDGLVTEKISVEDILEPHEHVSTSAPTYEEIKTTAEPDKGLNTIPSDINGESSSQSTLEGKTTISVETQPTESPGITNAPTEVDTKPPTFTESSTPLSESHITKGEQYYTVTTEPSFRKEDEIIMSTEKSQDLPGVTTIKAEFVDEGLIPTSTHDEKQSTGSNAPSVDEEVTTMIPEYSEHVDKTSSFEQSTTEAISRPMEPISEEETGLVSTEKTADVTVLTPDTHEEPSRIPGEGDCLLNGVTYRNNTVVPSTNNCHTGCKCVSSIIKCDPIICSPPPDYMHNCQSIYDTLDSCCPTYVCDHPKETIPPQSDNQMSGTEPPSLPPTIECRGDQCELSEPVKKPTDSSEPCTSGNCLPTSDQKPETGECGDKGCKVEVKEPVQQPSAEVAGCKDGKCQTPEEGCPNGQCELPSIHVQVTPTKPCDNEDCKVIEKDEASPQLCENEDNCKTVKIPSSQPVSCKGNSCTSVDCGGSDCDSTGILPSEPQEIVPSDCSGHEPCRRNDIPITDKQPPKCEGKDCEQKINTSVTEAIEQSNTEPSVPKQPLSEPSTEKIEEEITTKPTDSQVTEQEKVETTSITQSVMDTDSEVTTDKVTENNSEMYDVTTEKPMSTEEEYNIKKPELERTEKPIITKEDEIVKPSVGQEDIPKPDIIYEGQTRKPGSVDESSTVLIGEQTDKPSSVQEYTGKIDEGLAEVTKLPSDSTEVPTAEKESTNKPYITEEHTQKPALIEGETTEAVDGLVDEQTDKAGSIEEYSTKKPDIEQYTVKPTLDEKENTKIPDVYGEEHSFKPSLPDEGDTTTKIPAVEQYTEKPELVEVESTKIPYTVEEYTESSPGEKDGSEMPQVDSNKPNIFEKESTETPDIVQDHTDRRYLDEDEDKKTSDGVMEYTSRPGLPEETGTKITDIVKEYTDVPALVEEEVTKISDISEDLTVTPTSAYDKITKKPETVEKGSTVEPESVAKPGFTVSETDEKVPTDESTLAEEVTKKPDTEVIQQTDLEENTRIPEDVADRTDKPDLIKEDEAKIPDVVEENTDKPGLDTEEITKTPEITQEEYTHKPILGEKDNTMSTDVVEEDSNVPISDKEEGPRVAEEYTSKPVNMEEQSTIAPDIQEPVSVEESITEMADSVTDKTDMVYEKPILVEEDLPEKEEMEEKPYVSYEKSTSTPSVLENTEFPEKDYESGPEKTTIIDESTSLPVGIESSSSTEVIEESTLKPTTIYDITKDKPSMLEQDQELPVAVEKYQTPSATGEDHTDVPKPAISEQHIPQTPTEEGSGMETTEPESAIVEQDKATEKAPESQTTNQDSPYTESYLEGIDVRTSEVSSTEKATASSEIKSPDSIITEPQDSNTIASDVTESVSEQEKTTKKPSAVTISQETLPPLREGEQEMYPTPENITPSQEPLTNAHDMTKTSELMTSTESVEKPIKSTDEETIKEEMEIYTDIPEQDSLVTKSPVDVNIEPQDGGKPVTESVESTTRIIDSDDKASTSDLHITDSLSESEGTPKPEIGKVTEIPEIVDTYTQKTDLPESHSTQSEKLPSETPIDVTDQEIKTGQSDVFNPENEEMITSTLVSAVTEPVRGFTEIEDAFVTGEDEEKSSETPSLSEEITTKRPEVSYTTRREMYTEAPIPSKIEPSETYIPQKPEATTILSAEEVIPTELPGSPLVPEAEKPLPEDQSQSTEISESDKKTTDSSDLSTTKIPMYLETEDQEKQKVPVDKIDQEDKATKSPDSSDITPSFTPTEPSEIIVTSERATEIPESHITLAEPAHQQTTEPPYIDQHITETPETVIKSEAPQSIDTQKTTMSPDVSSKPEDEQQHPEITHAEPNKPGMKDQLPEVQKSSTEYPTTFAEIRTELPHAQVTTEASLSLVTDYRRTTLHEAYSEPQGQVTVKSDIDSAFPEVTTSKDIEEVSTSTDRTSAQSEFSETTPYLIELEEHTHKMEDDSSTTSPSEEEQHTDKTSEDISTPISEDKMGQDITTQSPPEEIKTEEHLSTVSPPVEGYTYKIPEDTSAISPSVGERATVEPEPSSDLATEKVHETDIEKETKPVKTPSGGESSTISGVISDQTTSVPQEVPEKVFEPSITTESSQTSGGAQGAFDTDEKEVTTRPSTQISQAITTASDSPKPESDIQVPTDKPSHETTAAEDELIFSTTKATTIKQDEILTPIVEDKPHEKPTSDIIPPSVTAEEPKPSAEIQPTDEVPTPDDDGHFPPSGTGYGEPDYVEEDQAFGPGTCRYGGKVYVSAQQIPRDDPCDFCFCFRSDIICLQQSCPPPIHGCHEEPIQGFCCPRYECPVSMATTVNVTTTTTTTTTTLPPHFPTHSYKGAAQRRGCQIKGHTYKVGEVVRSSSGPCLHCTCGGDGQMKCDPKACTPEPMLRQMIAAAVSAKRRR